MYILHSSHVQNIKNNNLHYIVFEAHLDEIKVSRNHRHAIQPISDTIGIRGFQNSGNSLITKRCLNNLVFPKILFHQASRCLFAK